MDTTKIIAPDGYEIDENNSNISRIVFKKIESKLPTRWGDLKLISGSYVSERSNVFKTSNKSVTNADKNVFATSGQARASLALAQLSQLMKVYNDGWEPDWNDNKDKSSIIYLNDNLIGGVAISNHRFLTFKTSDIRDKFVNNFRDLIEQAKPLL